MRCRHCKTPIVGERLRRRAFYCSAECERKGGLGEWLRTDPTSPRPIGPPRNCLQCGTTIAPDRLRRHAIYCSRTCEKRFRGAKLRQLNPRRGLSPNVTGTIGELLVAIDLMARGCEVFRALGRSAACDLAILLDHRLLRVEATTGTLLESGLVHWAEHTPDKYDLLAVVYSGTTIEYLPSTEAKSAKTTSPDESFARALSACTPTKPAEKRSRGRSE